MKNYKFEASESFKDLLLRYGLDGISDLDIGEEASEHNITYKQLETWDYDDNSGKLEIYVED
ncbi:MAG: hypothetical protein ACLSWP_12950 [Terrisporobacter sp.]|uniref:hypothetical protein n=1 Tax=Terrisporobacter sp. TaxID=1965305 RepID=UPI0039923C92